MLARKIVKLILLLGMLGVASGVNAQSTLPGSGSKTFGERLDDFTSKIFGGLFTSNNDNRDNGDNKDNAQNSKQAPRPVSGKYQPYQVSGDNPNAQSGTVIRPVTPDQQPPAGDSSSRAIRVYRSDNNASSPGRNRLIIVRATGILKARRFNKIRTLRKTRSPCPSRPPDNRRFFPKIRIPREPWSFRIRKASLRSHCTKGFRNFAIRHLTIFQNQTRPTVPRVIRRHIRLRAVR